MNAPILTFPVVSVVVPCYRQAQFLTEAVESVVSQTFPDWEMVIVDDGSPDNTAEVAASLIERHGARIRLVQQRNGGVARARNTGIAASRGRFILALDADDRLHPEMLTETVRLLNEHPETGVAYVDYQLFGAVERTVPVPEFDFDGLFRGNHIVATALFRRGAWEASGGYNPNMTAGLEDWEFWISCVEHGFIPRRIPRVLFFYRVRPGTRGDFSADDRRAMMAQAMRNHPTLFTPRQRLRRRVTRIPRNARRTLFRLGVRLSGGRLSAPPEPW